MASRSVNKVILIGNLGKDPELRYTSSGVAVASFSVATNESWKDPEGNTQERTQWHNIVAWRKLAETCNQFLTKGKLVYVEGSLRTRLYDGKDGQKRVSLDVTADKVIFLDKQGAVQLPPEEGRTIEGDIEPEDIPF